MRPNAINSKPVYSAPRLKVVGSVAGLAAQTADAWSTDLSGATPGDGRPDIEISNTRIVLH